MIVIYTLYHNGTVYGRFTKEEWANRAAELFAQLGMSMEVDCNPFVVSTKKEAEECFARIKNNIPHK